MQLTVHLFFVLSSLVLRGSSLLSPPPGREQFEDNFVLVDYHDNVSVPFLNYSYKGVVASTNRSYMAFVAVLSNNINERFSYQLPQKGCNELNTTSTTAKLHNCLYATNAGYFSMNDNHCIGNLIIDGIVIQIAGLNRVNFAVTNGKYIIGYITNSSLIHKKYNWTNLISGAGWLLRRGEDNVNISATMEGLSKEFVTEKAPRTGLCAARNGTLIIVQVDGEEIAKLGLDLYEFAEVLKGLGCWEAVNLDGGGSSTSVYHGSVIDQPTCIDTSVICERSVSSVTCIK